MIELNDIVRLTKGKLIKMVDTKFSQVEIDTRKLINNSLFVTTRGNNLDTNDLILEAITKGATGIVFNDIDKYEQYCNNYGDSFTAIKIESKSIFDSYVPIARSHLEKLHCDIISITGTSGKSTTTKLINHLLSQKYISQCTDEFDVTIPAISRAILKLNSDTKFFVVETALFTDPIYKMDYTINLVKPKVGIITNVSNNHSSIKGGFKEIIRQKSEVITCLDKDGVGILNEDDPSTKEIIKLSKCKIITFGIDEKADIMAKDIEIHNFFTNFTIIYDNKNVRVKSPILGKHNVYSVLAAAACAINKGYSLTEIKDALNSFEPIKLRMENIFLKNGVTFIDDSYNSSLISMKGAIETLWKLKYKRKIMVLGGILDVGAYTTEIHNQIVKHIENRMPDILITYGEEAYNINKYLTRNVNISGKELYHCRTKDEIKDILKGIMRNGDIVLLKGSHYFKFEEISSCFINEIGRL